MPTKTFFNLPENKRRKLLDAIHEEFSRVPFSEVSINQIIRIAGISRGSFYQYFEDKQDMLEYLLSDYQETLEQHALSSLKKNEGDLFQMFVDVFDFTYAFVTEEKNNAFFKNVFSDIRLNIEMLVQQTSTDAFGDYVLKSLSQASTDAFGDYVLKSLPRINVNVLDIRSKDDFGNMLNVLLPLTGTAFAKVFFDVSNYAYIRSQFIEQLNLLKRGFLKEKGVGN